jgi:hypothetical protein
MSKIKAKKCLKIKKSPLSFGDWHKIRYLSYTKTSK